MERSSDSELWQRAVAGEPAAFGALYERHARTIYNYLFRRCADWSLAEDLTSIVFLETYRRRRQVAIEDGSLLPWLYGVATNVLRNQRRSLRRHADALRRLPAPEPVVGVAREAAERVDAARHVRALLAALQELPQRDQDVLALCLWQELSYEDAAAALGIPIGTVRSRLSRARTRLAKLAARNGPPFEVAPKERAFES